jgi:hypothetical protein
MRTRNILALIALPLLLASCGINQAIVLNQNQNSTQVQLTQDNFRNVGNVSGTANVKYILLFGGAKRRNLFGDAYSAMIASAELAKGPRAVVNVVTEEHIGGLPPIFFRRTLTVSGTVVEFTR